MLGDQPHQRHQADLAIHVERAAGQPQRTERAGHRQRYRQHDDEGVAEALELRRQHQVDEGEREQEDEREALRAGLELARLAVVVGAVARRQDAAGGVLHPLQRLAERVARRQVGGDRHRAALAEVVELARRHALVHLHDAGQRHHAAVARAHVDVADVARVAALVGGDLHDHVVLLCVLLVARDLAAAEHALQRTPDHVHRHAEVRRAIAIHLHRELGHGQLEVRVGRHQAGVPAHFVEEGLGHAGELVVAL